MKEIPVSRLRNGDVIVMYGRKRIVTGEPRPTQTRGTVSVQLADRNGYLIGEMLAFSGDTVTYWGRATALRSSETR